MDRDDQVRLAKRVLPRVTALASDVSEFIRAQGFADLPYGEFQSDERLRADLMVRSFVLIQGEHLQSAMVLADAGQHRDAWLIVRTMVEGTAQLIWALSDEPNRTDEWFWFGAVEDWRQLNHNRENGLPISVESEALARRLLKKHGKRYFSKQARTAQSQGRPLPPDPYRITWHRIKISDLIKELVDTGQSSDQLRRIYRSASEWVHWNPRAVFRTIDQEDAKFRYEATDPREAARALAYGISVALDPIRVADGRFLLGLAGAIEDFNRRLASADDEERREIH